MPRPRFWFQRHATTISTRNLLDDIDAKEYLDTIVENLWKIEEIAFGFHEKHFSAELQEDDISVGIKKDMAALILAMFFQLILSILKRRKKWNLTWFVLISVSLC